MRAFYFGCVGEHGHYFWTTDLRHAWKAAAVVPWGLDIDDRTMMPSPDEHGAARLHHKDGWTALVVADNSIDHRPGSKSAFVFEAHLSEADAWRLAEQHFPTIVARVREATEARS